MEEKVEFRIYKEYAHLLLQPNEGRDLGFVVVIDIPTSDPRFEKVKKLTEKIRKRYNDSLFSYSKIKRKYSKEELDATSLFHLKVKSFFEPAGEECGTIYDETTACKICGDNRKQLNPLFLKKGKIPKKDIAETIGGEVVVSEKFVKAVEQWNLKGLILTPIHFSKSISDYYQLTAFTEIDLSSKTIAGVNVFNLSTSGGGEIYKCPKGHTIGLNLLSEPYVSSTPLIKEYDFLASRQKVGVKRGLLRPEPIYLCSQLFRKMVEHEKLTGFEFEIAHIE